jgi:hypothetical protein
VTGWERSSVTIFEKSEKRTWGAEVSAKGGEDQLAQTPEDTFIILGANETVSVPSVTEGSRARFESVEMSISVVDPR